MQWRRDQESCPSIACGLWASRAARLRRRASTSPYASESAARRQRDRERLRRTRAHFQPLDAAAAAAASTHAAADSHPWGKHQASALTVLRQDRPRQAAKGGGTLRFCMRSGELVGATGTAVKHLSGSCCNAASPETRARTPGRPDPASAKRVALTTDCDQCRFGAIASTASRAHAMRAHVMRGQGCCCACALPCVRLLRRL